MGVALLSQDRILPAQASQFLVDRPQPSLAGEGLDWIFIELGPSLADGTLVQPEITLDLGIGHGWIRCEFYCTMLELCIIGLSRAFTHEHTMFFRMH